MTPSDLLKVLSLIILLSSQCCTLDDIRAEDLEPYTREMISKATNGICWYEYLKQFPIRTFHSYDVKRYVDCFTDLNYVKKAVHLHWGMRTEIKKLSDVLEGLMHRVTPEYKSCYVYINDSAALPEKSYQDFMGDKENYPYRGLVHCMMAIFENRYGSKALKDIDQQRKHPGTFLDTIFERENEIRGIHQAPKLALDPELIKQAQSVAEELARTSTYGVEYGSSKYHHVVEIQFPWASVGESVEHISFYDFWLNDDVIGLLIPNDWYRHGIEHYPWPPKTWMRELEMTPHNWVYRNHTLLFTQQIWKASKLVGYGMARNNDTLRLHVVARYWPAGNPKDETSPLYEENVLPLKND